MNIDVNLTAVFVAALAGMVVGAAWYSKFLFGSVWMKLMKMSADAGAKMQKEMAKSFALGFVVQLVTAYVLAHFVALAVASGGVGVTSVLTMAFWLWLGFVVTTQIGSVLWENRPWKLFFINAGHTLVVLLVMAWVLSVF